MSPYVEEGLTLAHRSGDLQALRLAHRLLAERDVLEGRPAAASARLVPLLDRPGLEEMDVTFLLPYLAWAHLEEGDLAQAAAVAAAAAGRARRKNHRLALVDALRIQALAAIRQQHWAAAEDTLAEGLALARSMPYPYAEARLQQVYGDLHVQKRATEAAREQLQAALDIFRRLGAGKDIERVEQAIAAL